MHKYSFNIIVGVHILISTADLNYQTNRGYDVILKKLSKISQNNQSWTKTYQKYSTKYVDFFPNYSKTTQVEYSLSNVNIVLEQSSSQKCLQFL